MLVPVLANGQTLRLEPSVQVSAVASDNTLLDARSLADVIVTTSPRVDITGTGSGFRLLGSVGLDATTHLGRTAADRLIPKAAATANARLVDRLLFVDAGFKVDTAVDNPYGVAAGNASNLNQVTTLNERFSPYVERELDSNNRIALRSDHNWVQVRRGNVNALGDLSAYVEAQSARYELRPVPAGLTVDFSRQTATDSSNTAQRTEQVTLRVSPTYAVTPQLNLLVTGGFDQARYATVDTRGAMWGAGIRWTPSERTSLDAAAEQRFFGTGANLNLSHRSPFLALNASLSRTASSYAAQLISIPAGVDVAQLLDAALTTRIPVAADRAAAVQQFINQRNLPSTLASAISLASGGLQRVDAASVSMALLGVRHSLAFRAFHQKSLDLLGPNDPALLLSGNARQAGGSVTLSRRLMPETTADVSLARTKVVGLGQNAASTSDNTTLQLGGNHRISLRTALSVGARHQVIHSTVVPSARENALTAAVTHRF